MKGILFDFENGMHQAVLLGMKTVTRREGGLKEINDDDPDDWEVARIEENKVTMHNLSAHHHYMQVPIRYRVGETVFIKEPIMDLTKINSIAPSGSQVIYRYPTIGPRGSTHRSSDQDAAKKFISSGLLKWSNKMFMTEKHARHFIRIKSVRVERIKDITPDDVVKEGIIRSNKIWSFPVAFTGFDTIIDHVRSKEFEMQRVKALPGEYLYYGPGKHFIQSAKQSFMSLLREVNGQSFVEKNSWVFRYEFEKLRTLH